MPIPKIADDSTIQSIVDGLITKREPELLKDILSYELYKAFMAGLLEADVLPMWSNLLYGAEYTDRFGRLQKWSGLVSSPVAQISLSDLNSQLFTVVDADMVVSQTIAVPEALIGRSWSLSKRAIGPLRPDEYDVSEDGASVSVSFPVVLGDTYIFEGSDQSLAQSTGDDKQSLIANYVYFWYMRLRASNTTDMGEVVGTSENSARVGPATKMSRAWNEMCEGIWQLWEFLSVNRTVYTQWRWQHTYKKMADYQFIPSF